MTESSASVKSAASSQLSRQLVTRSPTKSHSDAFIFVNGDQYIGEYLVTEEGQMMRHGQGKHISADQQIVYDGTWSHDKMHGPGRLSFGNGSSYDGEFQSNFFDGLGTFTWSSGAQYTGMWEKSKPVGKAEYIGPDLGVPFVGVATGREVHMRYKVSS